MNSNFKQISLTANPFKNIAFDLAYPFKENPFHARLATIGLIAGVTLALLGVAFLASTGLGLPVLAVGLGLFTTCVAAYTALSIKPVDQSILFEKLESCCQSSSQTLKEAQKNYADKIKELDVDLCKYLKNDKRVAQLKIQSVEEFHQHLEKHADLKLAEFSVEVRKIVESYLFYKNKIESFQTSIERLEDPSLEPTTRLSRIEAWFEIYDHLIDDENERIDKFMTLPRGVKPKTFYEQGPYRQATAVQQLDLIDEDSLEARAYHLTFDFLRALVTLKETCEIKIHIESQELQFLKKKLIENQELSDENEKFTTSDIAEIQKEIAEIDARIATAQQKINRAEELFGKLSKNLGSENSTLLAEKLQLMTDHLGETFLGSIEGFHLRQTLQRPFTFGSHF